MTDDLVSQLEAIVSDLCAINAQLAMVRSQEVREKLGGYLRADPHLSDSAKRRIGDIEAMEVTATAIELEAELFTLQERKWLIHTKLRYADACRPTLVDR